MERNTVPIVRTKGEKKNRKRIWNGKIWRKLCACNSTFHTPSNFFLVLLLSAARISCVFFCRGKWSCCSCCVHTVASPIYQLIASEWECGSVDCGISSYLLAQSWNVINSTNNNRNSSSDDDGGNSNRLANTHIHSIVPRAHIHSVA